MEKIGQKFVILRSMVKFVGDHIAKLDDKGRLVFPSAFKSLMESAGEQAVYVVKKDLFLPCLNIFTYAEWERESEQIKQRLNFFNPEHVLFWHQYTSDRALVEPDRKIGRISIPAALLESIGVAKEAVFHGSDHKIELWSRENFDSSKASPSDIAALAQKILG